MAEIAVNLNQLHKSLKDISTTIDKLRSQLEKKKSLDESKDGIFIQTKKLLNNIIAQKNLLDPEIDKLRSADISLQLSLNSDLLLDEYDTISTLIKKLESRWEALAKSQLALTRHPLEATLFNLINSSSLPYATKVENVQNCLNQIKYHDRFALSYSAKPNINAVNERGQSAIVVAAKLGYTSLVKCLIKGKANLHIKDIYGNTALAWAARNNSLGCVSLLISAKVNVNQHCHMGATPLMIVVSYQASVSLLLLIANNGILDLRNDQGETALIIAAAKGNTEAVSCFIQLNAKLDIQDNNGMTALLHASQQGHVEIVKLLLHADANYNIVAKSGYTAYELAYRHNHYDVLSIYEAEYVIYRTAVITSRSPQVKLSSFSLEKRKMEYTTSLTSYYSQSPITGTEQKQRNTSNTISQAQYSPRIFQPRPCQPLEQMGGLNLQPITSSL